jgi:hypothetical protein
MPFSTVVWPPTVVATAASVVLMLAAQEALSLTQEARAQRRNGKPIIRFVPSRILPTTVQKGLNKCEHF